MTPRGLWRAGSRATAAGALVVTLAATGTSSTRASAAGGDGGTPVGAREVVGCTAGSGSAVVSEPRSHRAVALTFDDGPSTAYTPSILAILERMGATATFFEEGRHVAGREALMRRILASGDEIGNHSFDHPPDPGFDQLAATNRLIHAATGFTPCLFRPPYGLVDPKVESAARDNGLQTVLWSVDSRDDKHPGAAAIRARVLSLAQPGSIVLMHDGGHHPQTVAALPGIVRGLRAHGLRFVTVTRLLGGRFVYRG
jgi:peptidoglycan-N-acetylglucosamine deacetylase